MIDTKTQWELAKYEGQILTLIEEVRDFALDLPSGTDYTNGDLQGIVQAIVLNVYRYGNIKANG